VGSFGDSYDDALVETIDGLEETRCGSPVPDKAAESGAQLLNEQRRLLERREMTWTEGFGQRIIRPGLRR
jgi:hypothetical protein